MSDFTEDAYRRALSSAKTSYSFEPFGTNSTERHVLWRHDVDASVHRAARLAGIEAEEGLRATYFLSFHSSFYNLLESRRAGGGPRAARLGHWLLLHFDSSFPGHGDIADRITLRSGATRGPARDPGNRFSFHNPGLVNDDLACDDDTLVGLVNAYGRNIR